MGETRLIFWAPSIVKILNTLLSYDCNIADTALKTYNQSIIIQWKGGTGGLLRIVSYFFQQDTTQQTKSKQKCSSFCQHHVY